MTDQSTEAAATETEATTEQQAEQPAPKPSETVDFWKQKAREQEKRAKENADAAQRLAKIEESQKSDAQRVADRLKAAENDAAEARRDALRYRIASRFRIDDEDAELFLTGSDEESLTRQAERLTAREATRKADADAAEAERKKRGNHVPREGATSTAPEGDERETARRLFGG